MRQGSNQAFDDHAGEGNRIKPEFKLQMPTKRYFRGQHRESASPECFLARYSHRAFSCLVYGWLMMVAIGVILTLIPEAPRSFLVSSTNWETNGGFFADGLPAEYQLPRSYIRHKENLFWRSRSPETQVSIATIHSKAFSTKASAISLPVAGYPNAPGNDLYIKNLASGERKSFRYGNAHEVWQELIVSIPKSWRRKPLIVGAESRAGVAYVGLGPPAEVSWTTVAKRSLPVCIAWHLGTCVLLIFLAAPCQCLMSAIVRRSLPGQSWRWVSFPLALALVGYVAFFGLYFFPLPTWCILFLSVISGAFLCKRDIARVLYSPTAFLARRPVITLWMLVSGVALIILYAQTTVSLTFAANYRFSPAAWSTDNQLPVIIGDFLTQNDRVELVKQGIGPWQVSDRPPVLNGLMAPFVLLSHFISSGQETSQLGPRWTQIAGTCVLTTWIFPVWVILRKAGLTGRQRTWAVGLLTISPFFFFNMVYAWPKLLSATLALLGWVLVAGWKPSNRLVPSGLLAGTCFSMSLMSHGSAFFGLLALGCVFIGRFLSSHWRLFVLTGAAFLLFTSPWLIWVRYCDPPGNALMKEAFAGSNTSTNKEASVGEAILIAYSHDTLKAWAERKLQGIEAWIGTYPPLSLREPVGDFGGNELRRFQFLHVLPALGFWLIPLILVPWTEKGNKRTIPNPNFGASMFMSLGMIGMVIQLLLMWAIQIIPHYAFSTIACLHLAAVISLANSSRRMREILSVAIFGWFAVVWVLSPIFDWGNCDLIQAGFILLALAIIGGVLWMPRPRHGRKSISGM